MALSHKQLDTITYERDESIKELERFKTTLIDLTQDERDDEHDGVKQQDVIQRIRTVMEDLSNYKALLNQKKLELQSKDKELTDSEQTIVELRNCLQHCKYTMHTHITIILMVAYMESFYRMQYLCYGIYM